MNSTSMRPGAAFPESARDIGWGAVATWLGCFGLIVYLGLEGGGYDSLVHDRVGIAVWWVALAGVLIGTLPRRRLDTLAWVALALLALFAAWTAFGLGWSENVERSFAELARVCGYLGIFALALFTRAGGEARRLLGAVAAGVAVVTAIALLSRLHPAWFPEARQTASFIADSRERLSYPIDYWNGLAALIAIGIPLVLQIATDARSLLLRAAAAAALPALALAIFLTLSRGGMAAALIAVSIFIAIAPDRLPKVLTLAVAGTGAAILVAVASQRDALQHGLLNATARQQGDDLLLLTLVVCLVAGLIQAGISHGLLSGRRPRWTFVSRRHSLVALVAAALAAVVLAAALDVPGRASSGWDEFRHGGVPGSGTGRLGSVAGQSRYQLWQAALHESGTEPLTGTGAGTFELWWARHNTTGESVRDTHSLYLQTLGELGVVGLLVLVAFLLAVFGGGGSNALRADPADRSPLAAGLAGCAAFFLTAAVDWMWQIPVLPVAMLLLAAVLVMAGPSAAGDARGALRPPLRVAFGVAAIAAIAAIAIPLAATGLVRASEADVRAGDLDAALSEARKAQSVEPDAAGPRLQQALVREAGGDLAGAALAARAAVERGSTDWRNWLVLSRIDAERGRAAASVRAYKRAKSLNPRSSLFEP
jgi:O-Antigen ligase